MGTDHAVTGLMLKEYVEASLFRFGSKYEE